MIIGVPKGYELTATTRPYMRSTYALVFRHRATSSTSLETADDLLKLPPEQLRTLRIGVFGRSPGADWLLRNDLLERAVDVRAAERRSRRESCAHHRARPRRRTRSISAIVWGPIAGFLVAQARRHLRRGARCRSRRIREIKFDYEISMGVRFGEKEWKDTLDAVDRRASGRERASILASFRVPLVDATARSLRTSARPSVCAPMACPSDSAAIER